MCETMKIPNFFIVGAPKCGTTALCEYLRSHPNVLISTTKEPHYFATDLAYPNFRTINDYNEYIRLFKCLPQHLVVGEASVFYLYSSVAINNIYRYNENAKIIAMLRNPIDLIASFHGQALYTLDEDEENLEKAWSLQYERAVGKSIPKHCSDPALLQYARIGKLGDQVERLLSTFPREQVKFILFDDFVQDTKAQYEEVLRFLNVPSDGCTTFPKINERKSCKSRLLNRLVQRPHPIVQIVGRSLKKVCAIERWGVLDKIKAWNRVNVARPDLQSVFRRAAISAFHEDIDKLAKILDRDLSHWHSV